MERDILYSFRRCPFAMRARWSILVSGLIVTLREVDLSQKPEDLITLSPNATVPLLIDFNGRVIDESLEIMFWALSHSDPLNGLMKGIPHAEKEIQKLIEINDTEFKFHLDRYKYSSRFPGEEKSFHKNKARDLLLSLESKLTKSSKDQKYWLVGGRQSIADWALWPFVRQYRLADIFDFDNDHDILKVRSWLETFLLNPLFKRLMTSSEPWKRTSNPSSFPQFTKEISPYEDLYHLTTYEDWNAAFSVGKYTKSTRGLDISEVGFIHACYKSQLPIIYKNHFFDLDKVQCMKIDAGSLDIPIRVEPNSTGEYFPHIYGSISTSSISNIVTYELH